jgi:ParB-like chromosome segregation protein Spo0J
MADTLSLAPAELLIDEINPRISLPNSGQHNALQALAQHHDTKLQVLADDIVAHGLDPSNLPIVMQQPGVGRYIVLEGNRRLAAIRAPHACWAGPSAPPH